MARVSLILPGPPTLADNPAAHLAALQAEGHEVEAIVAGPGPAEALSGWQVVQTEEPGVASAAIAGLQAARGDYLIVLDPASTYEPGDTTRLVAALTDGSADVAVACRPSRVIGPVARALVGTADPMSGLIALARVQLDRAGDLTPLGSMFGWTILAQVGGRRVDVPVRARRPVGGLRGLGMDDIRQLKRLADDRFGNASRLIQFCVVGASGMVVDLTCYHLFQRAFAATALAGRVGPVAGVPLDLAAARATAIAVALAWNFSLNRRLTFSYARRNSLVRQFVIYVLSNSLGMALSFSLGLALPAHFAYFRRHKLAAAVVGIVAATGISFSMSRWVVFKERRQRPDPAEDRAATPLDPRSEVAAGERR